MIPSAPIDQTQPATAYAEDGEGDRVADRASTCAYDTNGRLSITHPADRAPLRFNDGRPTPPKRTIPHGHRRLSAEPGSSDNDHSTTSIPKTARPGIYTYDASPRTCAPPRCAATDPLPFTGRNTRALAPRHDYGATTISLWLSRDPIGEWGGANLYGMVGNNPVSRIDFLGLQSSGAGGFPPGYADIFKQMPCELKKKLCEWLDSANRNSVYGPMPAALRSALSITGLDFYREDAAQGAIYSNGVTWTSKESDVTRKWMRPVPKSSDMEEVDETTGNVSVSQSGTGGYIVGGIKAPLPTKLTEDGKYTYGELVYDYRFHTHVLVQGASPEFPSGLSGADRLGYKNYRAAGKNTIVYGGGFEDYSDEFVGNGPSGEYRVSFAEMRALLGCVGSQIPAPWTRSHALLPMY